MDNVIFYDNDWGIAVFATNESIELLLNSHRIYVSHLPTSVSAIFHHPC